MPARWQRWPETGPASASLYTRSHSQVQRSVSVLPQCSDNDLFGNERIETNARDPHRQEAHILTCHKAPLFAATARKQEIAGSILVFVHLEIIVDRFLGLLGDLKPERSNRLPLPDVRAIDCVSVRRNIVDTKANDTAPARLAVYGEVDERSPAIIECQGAFVRKYVSTLSASDTSNGSVGQLSSNPGSTNICSISPSLTTMA